MRSWPDGALAVIPTPATASDRGIARPLLRGAGWRIGRPLQAIVLAFSLVACSPGVPELEQHAYVWKRVGTERVDGANLPRGLSALRVLRAQFDADGRLSAVMLPPDTGVQADILPVVRIEGSVTPADAGAIGAVVQTLLEEQAARGRTPWIEIDHDVARSRVPEYADWLGRLRARTTVPAHWSITALPDWAHHRDLGRLLQTVDAYTLQVHAVAAPADGLFDARGAHDAIRRFAERSPRPFFVALPTYAMRVGLSADGAVRYVESETSVAALAADDRVLFADPFVLQAFVRQLRQERPSSLQGVAWFRLPDRADQRAISPRTFAALVDDIDLAATQWLDLVPVGNSNNRDLWLRNAGPDDAAAAAVVRLPPGCRVGERRAGIDTDGASLRPPIGELLRAGQRRRLGWAFCTGASFSSRLPASVPVDAGAHAAAVADPSTNAGSAAVVPAVP